MKIIRRDNFWQVFCQAFTVMALVGTALDVNSRKSMNYSQFNLLMIAVACVIAVAILSQSYRLETFSPLAVMVIQYVAALACILGFTWMTGFWEPVSPHGYWDVFVTFSIPYLIGMMIYYFKRKKEITRQNEDLRLIKRLKEEKCRDKEHGEQKHGEQKHGEKEYGEQKQV